jgi:hypothetical protein
MGIPVGTIEYGFDCTACAFCFPPGKTPKYIVVKFMAISKCYEHPGPDPPNGVDFFLTQKSISDPCKWSNYFHGESPIWDVYYYAGYGNDDPSVLGMGYTPGPTPVFNAYIGDACGTIFPYNFIECPDYPYGDGSGEVSFLADPIPVDLTETKALHPGESNLYEKTPTIENLADYRIANKQDKTNVLCRVCVPIIGRANEVLEFTGTLSPESTGNFTEVCTFDSQPYYYNSGEGWFLWYDSTNEVWVVSVILGTNGTAYWTSANKISESYSPHGTATGIGSMQIPA